MLSAKTAHELQLSLYKLVICHIYYRISVFKMAGKNWLLAAFLRNKTNPSHIPISLSLSPPFQNTGQPQLHLKE